MTATAEPAASAGDRLARRNTVVLAAAQALGGATSSIAIAIGGLAGGHLLGEDKSLQTLPVTAFVTGTALGSVPAAMLMRAVGRRPGFIAGALLGSLGGGAACLALYSGSFLAFCAALALAGVAGAFVQQYRYAAADTASESFRPKAISLVLLGGVLAGVIGPQTVILTDGLFPVPYAGPFAGQVVLTLLACLVLTGLRIPRPPATAARFPGRPLLEIALTPRFVVAVLCGISSYALMSLVMTAAPIAMVAHHHARSEAALGIQWHILAMFGPSFVTGHLIARWGAERIVAAGLLLLGGCALVALSGVDVMHFWGALILLGLGWNFGFIGATTMVAATHRPDERAKVQALNDFLVFGSVALASFSSGKLLNAVGWEAINVLVLPIAGLCLASLIALVLGERARREH